MSAAPVRETGNSKGLSEVHPVGEFTRPKTRAKVLARQKIMAIPIFSAVTLIAYFGWLWNGRSASDYSKGRVAGRPAKKPKQLRKTSRRALMSAKGASVHCPSKNEVHSSSAGMTHA
jgi:hypothetical protein